MPLFKTKPQEQTHKEQPHSQKTTTNKTDKINKIRTNTMINTNHPQHKNKILMTQQQQQLQLLQLLLLQEQMQTDKRNSNRAS